MIFVVSFWKAMRMRANGEKILRLNTGTRVWLYAPDEVIHDLIMNARDSELFEF